jgi:hypothetical protein
MKKLGLATVSAITIALFMATGVLAIFFNNGNFESGDWTPGWDAAGQREFLLFTGGYDGTGFPNLSAGGSDLSSVVGGPAVPALSIPDPRTATGADPAGVLKYPAVGHYSAKVNNENSYSGGGFATNANTLFQTAVIDAGDIDSIDNMVHLRLLYAAVVSFPRTDLGAAAHTFDELPMFFMEVKNETDGTIVFHKQSYAGEPGVPWQDGPMMNATSQWKFLDWSYVDVILGDSSMVGKTISVKIVATGCSLGGHPGYIYVDELGSSHVGIPAVVATGPATRQTGSTITYTYNYFNGTSASIDPTISVNPPAGVTFTSADPACTSNGSGGYDCAFTNVPAGSNGSFQISGTVTAPGGDTIYHGDYNISATGYPTLIGPVVVTNVVDANTLPVAVNDNYSTNMSVTINGTTVLANDTDPENDPLTASLVKGPSHASAFTFNPDGTFMYEPENGFQGNDRFTYTANDGTADSNVAVVSIRVTPLVKTFLSVAELDGWVEEGARNIGKMDANRIILRLGDTENNSQYRSFLSFNTSGMDTNAILIRVAVRIRRFDTKGVDPFTWPDNRLVADIRYGFFGMSRDLEPVDFSAPASKSNIGTFQIVPAPNPLNWYVLYLNPADFQYVNMDGLTQFRLRFTIKTRNQNIEDWVRFAAGNNFAKRRPTLILYYYVPHP